MGLLEFFCHLIDDAEYRRQFINSPLTADRLKELRRYRLSPQQIGMVLREDKTALISAISAEISGLDMHVGPQRVEPSTAIGPSPVGGSAAGGVEDSLRTIVRWPGPLSVAVETLTPGHGLARKPHEVMVKGWNFAQQMEFEFELGQSRKKVRPKWVHVALTGESWAAIELSLPRKGKWTVTATNLIGDQRPSPVSTSLPEAFVAQ